MKNLRIVAFALMLGLISSFQSSANPDHQRFADLKQKIANKIGHPTEKGEGQVTARFTITEEGKVDVIDVRSWNDELEEYVENKLNELSFEGKKIDPRKLFVLTFVFNNEA